FVESNWLNYANAKVPDSLKLPHDAVGSDGYSVGLFQQQVVYGNGWWWGDAETCMSPYKSAVLFFQRLKKLDYNGPNSPGSYAQAVQQSAFPGRYDQRMGDAQALYDRITASQGVQPVDPNRPDFNEYPVWSDNAQDRDGTPIDLFLLHTQEGGGGDDAADNLAHWLDTNGVSYHYTISQASDGGVTVCDVVDTDLAAWAVLSANNRSINLCFAGSSVNWTRQQWLQQAKAIDVAAYLAVQDCKKYGITPRVIVPPYNSDPPGISDHKYVTEHLGDGTHSDVGPNFPWDVFTAAVGKYATEGLDNPEPPPPPPADDTPDDPEHEVLAQTRGRWERLGWQTPVEALAEIRDHLLGTNDKDKAGFRW
ncbi:N-acetylmuramoyl-L-alanine amidase, partial [Mycobacterium asiaticum]|uniref:N-acetylmuramoyl-L-alanine amidase n=1 Tax=Mycobacterium asiaticum TaxID=1790 RepID=UPI0007EF7131